MVSPFHDPAFHDAAAARRFPGPEYHEVLRWIHEALRPATYVEIGVLEGGSLGIANPSTLAIGIDPHVNGVPDRVFPLTSNEFFARYDLRRVLGGKDVDFALIDGLHLYEQALEDFLHLERFASPGAVFALHDTIPLDEETSARERTTEFYTGDVWKTVALLRKYRPELHIVTVKTAPTGLTLIRNLGWRRRSCLSGFPFLADWGYFEAHHPKFLGLVSNDRAIVESFCQNTPVQSTGSSESAIP